MKKSIVKYGIIILLLLILLFFLQIILGSTNIKHDDILRVIADLLNGNITDENIKKIIFNIRIPRFFMAFITGAVLAVSGVIMQIVLKNPLAEPFTLGVSSGASFGAVMGLYLVVVANKTELLPFLPLFAIAGGLLSTFFVLFYSRKINNFDTMKLILAGIMINAFFSSCISILFVLLSDKVHIAISWMMGFISLPDRSLSYIYVVELLFLIYYLMYTKEFDAMMISEKHALSLGVESYKIKQRMFIVSSIGTSLIVSQTGIIGFIGIMIPHLARNTFSNRFLPLSVFSFITGGIFLVFCETMSLYIPNIIGRQSELPIGVITSFFGLPFFLYILIKKSKLLFL